MLIVSRRRQSSAFDSGAGDLIARVEAADGQVLQTAAKTAINDLFIGLKSDESDIAGVSNFAALKAAAILMGPRTLAGALLPMVVGMPTPSGTGYAAANHTQKSGITGGTGKFISSERNNNADPQNNFSQSVFLTASEPTQVAALIGGPASTAGAGATNCGRDSNNVFFRNRCNSTGVITTTCTGFIGTSRSSSGSFRATANGVFATISIASSSPSNFVHAVGAATTGAYPGSAPIGFYHIGEAVNLERMRSRLNAYYAAISAL